MNVSEELARLAALRDQGVLTEAEFQAQKRITLGGGEPPVSGSVTASEPAKSKKQRMASGCAVLVLLLFVIGCIGAMAGGDNKTGNAPAALEQSSPRTPEQKDYMEQIDREITSLKKPETSALKNINTLNGIMVSAVLPSVYAKIYEKGAGLDLGSTDEAKRQSFRTLVSEYQARIFPQLRAALPPLMSAAMENKVYRISIDGRDNSTLKVSGPLVNSELAALVFMQNIKDTPRALRFREVSFHGNDGGDPIVREIDAPADTAIAEMVGDDFKVLD